MSSPNFDRIARIYRWLEYFSFGLLLDNCRNAYLAHLGTAQRALVLGDGDGRFTTRLLASNSSIFVDAVDVSTVMLSLLQKRASAAGIQDRLRIHGQDIRNFHPSAGYDLVISHFFLDCLTEPELQTLASKIRNSLSSSGQWVVSEFAVPHTPWKRAIAVFLIGLLYRIFGWLTGLQTRHLPDYTAILEQENFVLNKSKSRLGGILVSQIWIPRS